MWFNLWGLRVGDMVPEGERFGWLKLTNAAELLSQFR